VLILYSASHANNIIISFNICLRQRVELKYFHFDFIHNIIRTNVNIRHHTARCKYAYMPTYHSSVSYSSIITYLMFMLYIYIILLYYIVRRRVRVNQTCNVTKLLITRPLIMCTFCMHGYARVSLKLSKVFRLWFKRARRRRRSPSTGYDESPRLYYNIVIGTPLS